MDIGIGLPNPVKGVDGPTLVEWARRAEERGFSSLATIDRIAYPSYESMVVLAAAAGATERVRLFTNVLLGPTRNPLILAKEAASLHRLSGGRFTLGVGVGGRKDDFDAVGESFDDRGRRWDESLELMDRVWRGEAPPGSPEPVGPTPEGAETVPLLIAGMGEAALRRTLRWGIGWTAGGAPPEQVAPFAERVRKAWAESGREGEARIVTLFYFSLGEDAEQDSIEYLRDYYGFLGEWAEGIASGAARTPQAIRERLEQFEQIGVDEVIVDPTVGRLDQVDRLADAVL